MEITGSCAAGVVFFLFFVSLAFAQEPGKVPGAPSTIRIGSSLVLVDVISQDPKSGLPIRDLKKEDFRVFDNGHEVPITSFDAGSRHDTRQLVVWLVVICNEQGKVGGSAQFAGNQALFRPALERLDKRDTGGVAHWGDQRETPVDWLPT